MCAPSSNIEHTKNALGFSRTDRNRPFAVLSALFSYTHYTETNNNKTARNRSGRNFTKKTDDYSLFSRLRVLFGEGNKKIAAYQFFYFIFVVLLYQHVCCFTISDFFLLLLFTHSSICELGLCFAIFTHKMPQPPPLPQLTADNARFNRVAPSL